MTPEISTGTDEWRFDDLRALYVNCTLKRSPGPSHTQGLIDRSVAIMERHGGCWTPTSWCCAAPSGWATTAR
jgi:hypothetical protein